MTVERSFIYLEQNKDDWLHVALVARSIRQNYLVIV